ncbi:MAG: hypothetical protein B6I20_06970 [Bacteroidetes bacterium 4572_117]|nr:MAG: hypothetical protein B6I20_06970 [Bacteroidetes bacterium 4572_117]
MKNSLLTIKILLVCLSFFIENGQIFAQTNSLKLSKQEKRQVIDSVAKFMADYYVFPKKGKEIADKIRNNHKNGDYASINNYQEFSSMLTNDLRSVNNDKHISIRYAPEMIKRQKESSANNNDSFDKYELQRQQNRNFGFNELKILDGNIGYLKLNQFAYATNGGKTAIAAMAFLANTNAIIIDLTNNGGGSPSMIQLLSSYFFDDPVHLNSFYIRKGNKTKQFWTQTTVQGKKIPDTDIYILTSGYTFSAAEEFTYNLKNMKRATIVGETTGGGAHPVTAYNVNDNYRVIIPYGKAINPITKTNWEGTGVEPHVKTTKEQALLKAQILALEKLIKNEPDKGKIKGYKWAIDGLRAKEHPVKIDKKLLKSYAGSYGPRKITFENGNLFYQRAGRPKFKMIPIKKDYFGFNDIAYFRLKIIKKNGKVIALEGHYDNGDSDRNEKD